MKLKRKEKGKNDFTFEGLSLGKLIAIREALAFKKKNHIVGLTPVEEDVFNFIERREIENVDCFGSDIEI